MKNKVKFKTKAIFYRVKWKEVAIAIIILTSIIPMESLQDDLPLFYIIAGFVRYENGYGVCNATVYIKNVDRNITKICTTSCNAGEKGYYSVLFEKEKGEFQWNDTISIEVFKNEYYGNATLIITEGSAYAVVNITIIPYGVYAIATSPTGISNERNITISYLYNGYPDYISIYYSNDGNATWNLAGNVTAGENLSFMLPSEGIYGFIAIAIGGGSNESIPSPYEEAEAYPYILDLTPPSVEIIQPLNGSYAKNRVKIKWNVTDNFDEMAEMKMRYSTDGIHWGAMIDLPSNGTYLWNMPSFPDGSNVYIKVIAMDDAGNHGSSIARIVIDKSPPLTNIQFSQPYYYDGNNWISLSASVYLNAGDNGSGVNATYYRIWNGSWTPWMEYTMPFNLAEEGIHYIEFYSIDAIGNDEEIKNESVYVDNSKPVITINYGIPYEENGREWISGRKIVYVNASDIIPFTINATIYSFRNSSYSYYEGDNASFNLQHGKNWINITAWDALGNTAYLNKTLYCDSIPPYSMAEHGNPFHENYITSNTPIYINATDNGSGVKEIHYIVDGNESISYGNATIYINGRDGIHEIEYYSIDNAGNVESMHNITFNLDNTPPETLAIVHPSTPNGKNGWYVTNVTIVLNASDESGVYKTFYSIDSMPFMNGTHANMGNGIHEIEYYSIDNVGNVESIHTLEIKIDGIKPFVYDFTPSISEPSILFNFSIIDENNVSAFIEYWNDKIHRNESVEKIGNRWIKNVLIQNSTYLNYVIHAVDEAGNWNHTQEKTVSITGNEKPVIRNVSFPSKCHPRFLNISCVVEGNITSVRINISLPDGSYMNRSMRFLNGTSYYVTFFDTGTYSFYIYAVNMYGVSNSSGHYSFKIYPSWDVNMDDEVNILDLIAIAQHFGSREGGANYSEDADVNGDGAIDILDMIYVAQHWTG